MNFSTQMCKIVTKCLKIACPRILPQTLTLLPHRFMQILIFDKIRLDFAQFFKLFYKILVWFSRKNSRKIFARFLTDFLQIFTDFHRLSSTKRNKEYSSCSDFRKALHSLQCFSTRFQNLCEWFLCVIWASSWIIT